MLISIIINAHNEGTEVQKTIQNIKQTIQHDDLEFIVFDDASTDGSCVGLDENGNGVNVIRSKKRIGVTRGRNAGSAMSTGDVLVHTDAHIRLFDEGTTLESAARLAVEKQAIVVPAVGNFTDAEGTGCKKARWYSSGITFDSHGLLKIKRSAKATLAPYQAVVGPSDGFYVTPKDVFFNRLGGFSPYMGRHGWAEIGAALRAWFTGVQFLSVPDFVVAHKFRSKFPFHVSGSRDIFVNICQTHLVCFDDETYKYVFEPELKRNEAYEEVKDLIFDNRVLNNHKQFIDRHKLKTDKMFFDTFR